MRSPYRNAVLAFVAGAILVTATPAVAQQVTESKQRQAQINQEVRTLREQVEEASEEEALALDRLDAAVGRRKAIEADIALIDARIADVEARLLAANTELLRIEQSLASAQDRLDATRDELKQADELLQAQIVEAYMGGGSVESGPTVFEAQTLREAAARTTYSDVIVADQGDIVKEFKRLKAAADREASLVRTVRNEVKRRRDTVVEEEKGLAVERANREVLFQQALTEQSAEATVLAEIQARKGEFEARMLALQHESSSITQFLRDTQNGQGATPAGKGILTAPIPGARLSSRFGPRTHPIYGDVRIHTGLDYASPSGTPIRAAKEGTVVSSGVRGGYGSTIMIDHGGSLATLYAHQSQLLVASGTKVTRGQVIGLVGSTGNSTGPHLHFEVRASGAPVDPLLYL